MIPLMRHQVGHHVNFNIFEPGLGGALAQSLATVSAQEAAWAAWAGDGEP